MDLHLLSAANFEFRRQAFLFGPFAPSSILLIKWKERTAAVSQQIFCMFLYAQGVAMCVFIQDPTAASKLNNRVDAPTKPANSCLPSTDLNTLRTNCLSRR